jgi:hypothetical protein
MTALNRRLRYGLITGALVGLILGLGAQPNSYMGVFVVLATAVAAVVAIAMLFAERSREQGAVLLLSAAVMFIVSWGIMAVRELRR